MMIFDTISGSRWKMMLRDSQIIQEVMGGIDHIFRSYENTLNIACTSGGRIMEIEEWLGQENQLGIDIWKRKYCNNG